MHYRNGREAKNGDKVVMLVKGGAPIVGILYGATAGNDSCNGYIALTTRNDGYANLSECLHVDDAQQALESFDKGASEGQYRSTVRDTSKPPEPTA